MMVPAGVKLFDGKDRVSKEGDEHAAQGIDAIKDSLLETWQPGQTNIRGEIVRARQAGRQEQDTGRERIVVQPGETECSAGFVGKEFVEIKIVRRLGVGAAGQ